MASVNLNRSQKKFAALILALLILAGFVWLAVFEQQVKPRLIVAFLDVGQGDAIYIEGPNHRQILLDGGPPGALLPKLAEVMPWYDRSIDVVIASHPDADHISGLIDVLSRYKVSTFIEPGVSADTATYQELKAVVAGHKVPDLLARRGMVVDLGEGVKLKVIFPDQDVSRWETNEASIVARLEYGQTSFLLTGDSPQKIEHYLVSHYPKDLPATILKLGHHGSKTSSSEEYLDVVAPTVAIVSAGFPSKYGHPHQQVIDRLSALHIKTLRTETSTYKNTITLVSDGISVREK